MDRTVQGSRAEPHAAVSLLGDLPHDGVAMEIFLREREQDLKRSGRERVKFSFRHNNSMFDISINDYTCDRFNFASISVSLRCNRAFSISASGRAVYDP